MQILRGIFLWTIGLGIAFLPFVASHAGLAPENSVYADYRLPYVIATLSFTLLIAGFNSTKLFEASRKLDLASIIVIELITQLIGLSCMYGWAFFDRSISALIAGNIAGGVADGS